MNQPGRPRVAAWLLERILPRDAAPSAIGDLGEEYAELRATAGPTRARWWYWRQAMSLAWAYGKPGPRQPATDSMRQDINYAVRSLARSPGYTMMAIAVLALGIGATSAIFSFVDGVLLKPLPYRDPNRLVQVWEKSPQGDRNYVSALNFADWQRQQRVFEGIAAYSTAPATLSTGTEPIQLDASRVSASYFEVFGGRAALGRTFVPGEDSEGRDNVVVLSHRVWRTRFGSDPAVIGRVITFDREPCTIVGVLPEHSPYDRGWTDVWRPLAFGPGERTRDYHWLRVVARLAPGVTFEQAQADMDAIGAGIARDYPEVKKDWGVRLDRLAERTVGANLAQSLRVLLGAVGLLLLLGCANLANLALARGMSREREVVVRAALGASRGRILRQFLAESVVLSAAGGALGAAAGYGMMRGLTLLLPPLYLPREAAVAMDARALLFCTLVSVTTGLLFGIAPAFHASRVDLSGSMRGSSRGATADRSRSRFRHALIVAEVAIACVLLAGAGLLGRSFMAMQRIEAARDPDHVLTAWLIAPGSRFASPEEARVYYRGLLDRVRALPGVSAGALSTALPLEGWSDGMPFTIVGEPDGNGGTGFKRVTPGYFNTVGLPIVRGRGLTEHDRKGTTPVVVINEALRAKYFASRDPIGARLQIQEIVPGQRSLGPQIPWEIVGVVANEHANGLTDEPFPGSYVSLEQAPSYGVAVLLRTVSDPSAAIAPLRAAVKDVDPNQPVSDISTVSEITARFVALDRLRTALLVAFSAIALLLSGVGVYSVISYSVAQRTREMGIRAALGASQFTLLGQVMGHAGVLALTGVVLGVGSALLLGRFLASLLFGVSPRDVPTLAAAGLTLAITAALAAWIPARRASRVDPMTALRAD
jgi:putative ABC transport system permease protein